MENEPATDNIQTNDVSLSELKCSNLNRLLPTTCRVSQSYELAATETLTLANQSTWQDTRSLTVTWGQSWTESETYTRMKGEHHEGQLEVGGAIGPVKPKGTYKGGTTEETTNSKMFERSKSLGVGLGQSTSVGFNREETLSWQHTESRTIECAAEMEVPPSHTVSYSLVFDTRQTTLKTIMDLKLTRCYTLLSEEEEETGDDSADFIYVNDIPGTITQSETMGMCCVFTCF